MTGPGKFNTLSPVMAAPPPSFAPAAWFPAQTSSHARARGWVLGPGINLEFPCALCPPFPSESPSSSFSTPRTQHACLGYNFG